MRPFRRRRSTIEDTGLPYEQLKQLIVKALYAGELSGLALADKLCLPYMLLEAIVEHLRTEKLSRCVARTAPAPPATATR